MIPLLWNVKDMKNLNRDKKQTSGFLLGRDDERLGNDG